MNDGSFQDCGTTVDPPEAGSSCLLFGSHLYPTQIPPVGPEVIAPGVFGALAAGSWVMRDLLKEAGKRVSERQNEKGQSYSAVREALEDLPDELMNRESNCPSIWDIYDEKESRNEGHLSEGVIAMIDELDEAIGEYNHVHNQLRYRIGLEFQNVDMTQPFPPEILRVSSGQVDIICDWDDDRDPIEEYVYPLAEWVHLLGSPLIEATTADELTTVIPKYASTHYIKDYDGSHRWKFESESWAEELAASKQRSDAFWEGLTALEGDFTTRDEKFRAVHEMCAEIDMNCSLQVGLVPNERFQVAVNRLQQRAGYHRPRRTWENVELSSEYHSR